MVAPFPSLIYSTGWSPGEGKRKAGHTAERGLEPVLAICVVRCFRSFSPPFFHTLKVLHT